MNLVRRRHSYIQRGRQSPPHQSRSQSISSVLTSMFCALKSEVNDPPYNFNANGPVSCDAFPNIQFNGTVSSERNRDSTPSTRHTPPASDRQSSQNEGSTTRIKDISEVILRAANSKPEHPATPSVFLPKPKMSEDVHGSTSNTDVSWCSPGATPCIAAPQSLTRPNATSSNTAAIRKTNKDGWKIEDKEKSSALKENIKPVYQKTNTGKGRNKSTAICRNTRWENFFDRGQKKLMRDIAVKREMKYKVKTDLRDEKCVIHLVEKDMEKKCEAIKQKRSKIAKLKADRIGHQEDLRLKLDNKYHIAKSKLRLNHLEDQLSRLEKNMEKRRQKVTKLFNLAHRLAFSIPLVAEAGPLEEDEERIREPDHPTPSIFLSKNKVSTSDGEAGNGNPTKCIPKTISSSFICNTVTRNSERNQPSSSFTSSQNSYSRDLEDIQVIDLD